jgi:NAD(P)H-hydrate repair Nnr-like enzyme with NAD(P)H-hydrate epimerase domain
LLISLFIRFVPKTLKDYKNSKPTKYVEISALGVDLNSDELIEKRARAARIKEYANKVKDENLKSEAARHNGNGSGGGNNGGGGGVVKSKRTRKNDEWVDVSVVDKETKEKSKRELAEEYAKNNVR